MEIGDILFYVWVYLALGWFLQAYHELLLGNEWYERYFHIPPISMGFFITGRDIKKNWQSILMKNFAFVSAYPVFLVFVFLTLITIFVVFLTEQFISVIMREKSQKSENYT